MKYRPQEISCGLLHLPGTQKDYTVEELLTVLSTDLN